MKLRILTTLSEMKVAVITGEQVGFVASLLPVGGLVVIINNEGNHFHHVAINEAGISWQQGLVIRAADLEVLGGLE